MTSQAAKSKHRVTGVIDGHLEDLAWHKRRDVPRQVLRVRCQRRTSPPDTKFSELRKLAVGLAENNAAASQLWSDVDVNLKLRQHRDLRCFGRQHCFCSVEPELILRREQDQLVLVRHGVTEHRHPVIAGDNVNRVCV